MTLQGKLIKIEGGINAALDWQEARNTAMEYVKQGFPLFWELDLGLFQNLPFTIANQTQYLALKLSIEHFRDSLWKEFGEKSHGVILYRGNAVFSNQFLWDEEIRKNLQEWLRERYESIEKWRGDINIFAESFESISFSLMESTKEGREVLSLFSLEVAIEYISLLSNALSDNIPLFLCLDLQEAEFPIWQAQLIHKEFYQRFHLALKNANVPFDGYQWKSQDEFLLQKTESAAVALCLPNPFYVQRKFAEDLEKAIMILNENNIPYRVIPENFLVSEWEGIDFIIYSPEALSTQGHRKILGFCAAGGTPISTGKFRGFPNEKGLSILQEILN